jgi:hypothetical protein
MELKNQRAAKIFPLEHDRRFLFLPVISFVYFNYEKKS